MVMMMCPACLGKQQGDHCGHDDGGADDNVDGAYDDVNDHNYCLHHHQHCLHHQYDLDACLSSVYPNNMVSIVIIMMLELTVLMIMRTAATVMMLY